ncbi:MAG: class I tRNA ligase family protein [Candidatus Paceibacterota bacterium]|jgi:isoleucyl-tRNA synthetase
MKVNKAMGEDKAQKASDKSKLALKEEEVLKFWQENKIFEKTLEKEAPKGEYVFYDGPPFATGLPHFGHILAGTMKDFVGRYKTMRGYHVPRRWGWDCHGLPVENIVQEEIGLKSRKDIEDFGLEKFNDLARSKVFTYVNDWKKIVPRMGRFVDMENDYRTMDSSYTESVWWAFKKLQEKGLVYEGFKSMHLCPQCGTTLSNFEVSQGYKDITDISVTAKFELLDEPQTFFLAWTTTPWTLPGNVALAVNPDIEYVKIKMGEENYILAESRLGIIKEPYEILEKVSGKKLVGKSYKPLFDYYNNDKLKNKENGFKVYGADFVTTEDGTGIVHIAPAFGEDDMNLGREKKLPFIQHVGMDGAFKHEVKDFSGQVKPKEDPQKADIEIIKYLAKAGTIFSKEKFTHSYPHCYRCDTPLINYASSSWFVEVTKIKSDLIKANQEIKWVPPEIGEGRFGKWLEGARDWAISRSRFWGAPLPVWRCNKCEGKIFVGSIDDIKKKTTRDNRFFVVRHGEAESNVLGILSSNPKTQHHLTDNGREQAKEAGENLKKSKTDIDIIYCSPFLRTKETAEIIADGIGYSKDKIVYDSRLHEIFVGVLDGKPDAEYQAFFESREAKFWKTPEGGENYMAVKKRMTDFLYEINQKHEGKKILIVSHNTPIWLMFGGAVGMTPKELMAVREAGKPFVYNGEVKELQFAPIPHNRNHELDLHRPFIDELEMACACGDKMRRIPEVFDCWFESGSMPYAESHYPFGDLKKFNPEKGIGYPADFIAEGLDQTRGWFYSMLVLSVALFGEASYKNVVVNGIVLAEDGQKMAKRLKNYTAPMLLVDKYSADAMRYYLLSSPVIKAQDLYFSDKGVDEVVKKVIMRLQNVYSFYEMYTENEKRKTKSEKQETKNILDKWVLARLKETALQMTNSTEKYELDRATWPINDFVEDLSTWYLRRSRDRFKSDDLADRDSAIATTKEVILTLSKLIAPSMPFLAEDLYKKIGGEKLSVHLDSWPEEYVVELSQEEKDILATMSLARSYVNMALMKRAELGIKVRQPLARLTIKHSLKKPNFWDEVSPIIRDEVNVKEVVLDENISQDGAPFELDTNITPELKEEGMMRDIVRSIQELRKESKLNPNDIVGLVVDTDEVGKKILEKYSAEIKKVTGLKDIKFGEVKDGKEVVIEGMKMTIKIN